MRNLLLTLFSCLFVAAPYAHADVTWDVGNSTFGDFDTPFVPFTGNFGIASGPVPAIGASFTQPAGLLMGSVNTVTISGTPTLSQTDLSGTALPAGTVVKLRFTKAAGDQVKFIGLLADPNQAIVYTALSSTAFMVTARIANPVESASGNAAAAFGMLIVTSEIVGDFGGTIFATDLHWLDIGVPRFDSSGIFAISGNGKAGVTATTTAIIPVDKLPVFGLTEETAGSARGYIDDSFLPNGSFTNQGVSAPAGFQYLNSANPQNKVLKVSIINSSWSTHDLQYGVLAKNAKPTVVVTGKLSRTVKTEATTISGTAVDDVTVASVECSTKNAQSGFVKATTFSRGKWTYRVAALQKGKSKKLYVRAKDSSNQFSSVATVTVVRSKK